MLTTNDFTQKSQTWCNRDNVHVRTWECYIPQFPLQLCVASDYVLAINNGKVGRYSLPSGGSGGKESTCNAGYLGLIPRLGRSPGEGIGSPLQYSCLGNSHEQRSLVGYSPWGCKESNITE